jgi:hypothetical protein
VIARNKKDVPKALHKEVESPSQNLRLVAHIARDDERVPAVVVA